MTKITRKKAPLVLVLGEDTRSFLSVIRSLGKAGYIVHVVCYDQTSPALKSKYIVSAQFYNYQAFSQSEWLNNVISLIERYQFDLVIPCDERAIYPLWSARDKMPAHTKLAIANQDALDTLFDKWQTKRAAIACGVPVAQGRVLDISAISYAQLRDEFGDKFVVKPLQSFDKSRLNKRQKVAIVRSETDFIAYKENNTPHNQPYLIEEFFAGRGEGLSVLSIKGEVLAAFAHMRVAEPSHGGGSSYRKSIPIDPCLLKATEAICRSTRLTGVAMFEYRRNLKTNEWILIEVNARFWGSLPLAIYAGVDFPRLYADYLVYNQRPLQPLLQYRNKVCARVLIADLYEMKREFEVESDEKSRLQAASHLFLRLIQILKALGPVETVDSFQLTDPRPFLAESFSLLKSFFISLYRRNHLFLMIRKFHAQRALRKLFRINPDRRILFVCYGNIMRSPFAEKCMREKNRAAWQKLTLDSFGFHFVEQRHSPNTAMKAALEFNCDLSKHHSKWLTQLDIRESDIVVYFDEKNRNQLAANYKVNQAFCAADFMDNNFSILSEIEDPYGGDLNRISHCYRQIQNSVDNLASLYKEAAQ